MANWWNRRDTFATVVFLVAGGLLCAGFLFRDPAFHNHELSHLGVTYLVHAAVVGFVLGGLFLAALLYLAVRSGRMSGRSAAGKVGLLGVLALLLYVPASFAYEWFVSPRSDFHPMLQFFPPDVADGLGDMDTTRVVFLGGSTTEYAHSDGRGWPDLVEETLRQSPEGQGVRTFNLSKRSYTTLHSWIHFETNIRDHQPDVVVIMHAINDLILSADHSKYCSGPFREDYGHHYQSLARLANIQPLACLVVEVVRANWYWRPREVVDDDVLPGLSTFERNLRRLVAAVQDGGAIPVLVTQPHVYAENPPQEVLDAIWFTWQSGVGRDTEWGYDKVRRSMNRYNDAVRRVATEAGVALIDVEREVPKSLKYFVDDCHYTDAAFDLVAQGVAQGLGAVLGRGN